MVPTRALIRQDRVGVVSSGVLPLRSPRAFCRHVSTSAPTMTVFEMKCFGPRLVWRFVRKRTLLYPLDSLLNATEKRRGASGNCYLIHEHAMEKRFGLIEKASQLQRRWRPPSVKIIRTRHASYSTVAPPCLKTMAEAEL